MSIDNIQPCDGCLRQNPYKHYTGVNAFPGDTETSAMTMPIWLRRLAGAISLLAVVPAFATDLGVRLEQLVAIRPLPLFAVLQQNGMIEFPLDVQQMADEMPARIKKASADALWFDVLVMVAAPRLPTKADVVFEFRTRCAVVQASAAEQQRDSGNVLLSTMSTLVKLARDQGLSPQWAAMCPAADQSIEAAYRQVMRFPALGIQVIATPKLAYITSVNSSLYFAF